MRNRKAYLLVVCILVVALLASLVIGCTPKNEGPTGSFGGGSSAGADEEAQVLKYADKYIQFELFADPSKDINKLSYVKQNVKITDIANKEVEANIVSVGAGVFRLYAPTGGYAYGSQYTITLSGGIRFVDYTSNKITFTVNTDAYSNIQYNDGTLVLTNELVKSVDGKTDPATGIENGIIKIQKTGKYDDEIAVVGTVFIVNNEATGLQQAYKVVSVKNQTEVADDFIEIEYTKPNLEEIYKNFSFKGQEELSDENPEQVITDKEKLKEDLENSQAAESILNIFGQKPKFNVDVKLEGKKVIAYVTVTVPDVVYGSVGKVDLIFGITNELSAVANSKINNNQINGKYDVDFVVDADITNKVTFNVGLFSHAAYSRVDNVQELVNKIKNIKIEDMDQVAANDEALLNKMDQLAVENAANNGEGKESIDLFRWTLPIANGAASISYDADLAFGFEFNGQFGVTASTTLKYNVGASYNMVDGIQTYAIPDEDNKACDNVSMKLDGNAKVKVGINQRLSLDVLAGVIGVGLRANVGNFNKLYGYADASWEAVPSSNPDVKYEMKAKEGFTGSMYLEGGIYWDVNVDAGVRLGGLIKLDILKDKEINKSFNISSGEKILYTGGNREIVRAVVGTGNEIKENGVVVVKSAKSTQNFAKKVFDIVEHKDKLIPINAFDVKVEKANNAEFFDVETKANGFVITMAQPNVGLEFSVNVTYSYNDCFGQPQTKTTEVKYEYKAALSFESDTIEYTKTDRGQNFVFNVVSADGAPSVTIADKEVEAKDVDVVALGDNKYSVTVDAEVLEKLTNNTYVLTVKNSKDTAKANLVVKGQVSLIKSTDRNHTHYVYAPDQVQELLTNPDIPATEKFIFTADVDMTGVKLFQVQPKFIATIDGQGHRITGLVVENVNDNKVAALIEVNEGTIKNLTVESNVAVKKLDVAMNSTYYVSGFVAVNKGTMENVFVKGNVEVNSLGVLTGTDVYVGPVVAKNEGEVVNCNVEAPAVVKITYKYDLKGINFFVTGAKDNTLVKVLEECVNGAAIFTNVEKLAY